MATLFLISGYFSSIAVSKKTQPQFLWEKFGRLLVPTFWYSVLSKGVIGATVARVRDGKGWLEVRKVFWDGVRGVRGVEGPVWYCALLGSFDVAYLLLRQNNFSCASAAASWKEMNPIADPTRIKNRDEPDIQLEDFKTKRRGPTLSTKNVITVLLMSSMSSFLIRIYWPIGTPFTPLNLNLGYVPQYILFYFLGICIHRRLRVCPYSAIARRSLRYLFVTVVIITVSALFQVRRELVKGEISFDTIVNLSCGGFNLLAFVYALWNEFNGFLFCFSLLYLFARTQALKREWRPYGFNIARYSYTAFLVHARAVVHIQCKLDRFAWNGVTKTVVVGFLGVFRSWIEAVLLCAVMKITGLDTICLL